MILPYCAVWSFGGLKVVVGEKSSGGGSYFAGAKVEKVEFGGK